MEKIVSLVPDLVFADSSTHSVIAEALEKVGIKVIAFNSRSFEDIYTTIELVSITTGHLDQGRKLVIEMRERVSAVSEKVTTIPVGKHLRVFWEIFDAPLMTAGPGTFISQLITIAGGINIFADVKEDWPKVSPEEVIMRNPDILMSSDSHGDNLTIDQVKSRTGWAELSAVKNGWIYLFDGDVVSRPGPRIVDALEAIAKALYPELFR